MKLESRLKLKEHSLFIDEMGKYPSLTCHRWKSELLLLETELDKELQMEKLELEKETTSSLTGLLDGRFEGKK